MLFEIIYNYFYSIFSVNVVRQYTIGIMGVTTNLSSWLALTTTFIIMGMLIVFMILVVRWCFRLTAGLFKGL